MCLWSASGGPLKPKYKILGADIAGRVEAAGRNVKQFQLGDEVFGDLSVCGFGAFAEYVSVHENALALKPASMTFEEASTIPQAAILALQGLRDAPMGIKHEDKRQIQPGQKVLINGAGGGVGTFAVQIAKSFGAEVTGVDNERKLDMLLSIGTDHVIDYTKEDYTKSGHHYDLILDTVAHRSIFDYKHALNSDGMFVYVGGSMAVIMRARASTSSTKRPQYVEVDGKCCMMNEQDLSIALRLSAQRALLDSVPCSLRAISLGWEGTMIMMHSVFDGEISDEDRELLSIVATEIMRARQTVRAQYILISSSHKK